MHPKKGHGSLNQTWDQHLLVLKITINGGPLVLGTLYVGPYNYCVSSTNEFWYRVGSYLLSYAYMYVHYCYRLAYLSNII